MKPILTLLIVAAVFPSSGNGIDLIGHTPPADLSGYVMALMQPWDFAAQAQATAQGVVPIEYKDLTSTRETDCGTNAGGGTPCIQNGVICPPGVNDAPNYAGGLGFCWTWRNHPGWFYRHNGALVTYTQFPYAYLMDWRRTAYQRAWADQVIADANVHGWTWVWADDAFTNPQSYTTFDTYGGAIGTQDATRSMLEIAGRRLHKAGIRIIANLGWTNLYPTLWDAWLPLVDGFTNEHAVGDVAGNQASCLAQVKVCMFGTASGIDPNFTVVSPG